MRLKLWDDLRKKIEKNTNDMFDLHIVFPNFTFNYDSKNDNVDTVDALSIAMMVAK